MSKKSDKLLLRYIDFTYDRGVSIAIVAAVAQWVRTCAPQTKGSVFESKPRPKS